ncbi:polysaccharide deacetylase family protein [Hyphomicrobium sp. MC1]|uniref:polysaccharide deacetylase family protein n=1 Tax=Hyphomicrobium sp. (strain MC1) TaxID=717785 RepID=UPI000213ED6A|nr:polysaccharide deacetylase family protein [Hyphomicrobium sp. MC1]CCB66028.1 Polysaccharide deacetylase [Hyphomicrobium sp. MC1]
MRQQVKSLAKAAGLERRHVAAARMWGERNFLATFGQKRFKPHGRILCYHSIDEPEMGVNDVSERQFRAQIELALKKGYTFVEPSRIARGLGSERDLAITFDDGRRSVATHAARILAEYEIPWTLFVVTDWTDHTNAYHQERIVSWKDLEHLMTLGVEIGSHSRTHPDFSKISERFLTDELSGSRKIIEDRLGVAPTTFAIPLGQSLNWSAAAATAAREAGYEIIYAQAEETRPAYTVPRTFVTHFDDSRIFSASLAGVFDRWEEWI